jgi:uncharacterized BrkB/YihY/UPF0761 family membrane protein
MKLFGRTARKVLANPGSFALAVARQFRANQGVLLAGAVAYYTLLSLIPLLILILMALSHIVPENRLLLTLAEYLEFVVPGQSTALVDEVRKFLEHKWEASCSLPCCSSAPSPLRSLKTRCR